MKIENFNIPKVDAKTYRVTKRILEEGGNYIFPIKPLALSQLVSFYRSHIYTSFLRDPDLERAVIPEEMEVAINPKNLALPGTGDLRFTDQVSMILDYGRSLTSILNKKGAEGISIVMSGASVYIQADLLYYEWTKSPLFRNYHARTVDFIRDHDAQNGYPLAIGRSAESWKLSVSELTRFDGGFINIMAVPVIILPNII